MLCLLSSEAHWYIVHGTQLTVSKPSYGKTTYMLNIINGEHVSGVKPGLKVNYNSTSIDAS